MAKGPGKLVRGLFKTFCLLVVAGVASVTLAGFIFFMSLLKGLPDVAKLKDYHHARATQVFSDEGRKIGEFTTERRYRVEFQTIPKHVIQAFLAAEDSSFYSHKGIDFQGVGRAVISNVMRGHYAQGGSTITQQVARALLLNSKKKEITRKIREMVLAWRMEKELTKNEILSLYLNEIYLGHGAFGIGAAAENYFGKKVEELSVPEGAMLAGLPQRPNEWNPFHNPYQAKRRQQYVLDRMVKERFLTPEEGEKALQEPLKLKVIEDINNTAAPYFTEYVRQYLMAKYGADKILTEGYSVYTTVKYDYQKLAEKMVMKGLRQVDKRLGWRGVQEHVEADKTSEFLDDQHEEILAKLTPYRILPPNVEENGRKELQFDLSGIENNEKYFGTSPLQEGEIYTGLVTQVGQEKGDTTVAVGHTTVSLPFDGMSWVKVDGKPLASASQILKPGDVILVMVEKIDRKLSRVAVSLEQEPEVQGALLSFELATGNVQAMIGGTNFEKSKFNIALQGKRQVGSTNKPIVYAAAFDKGFSPSSIVTDSPIVFKHEDALDADSAGEDWRPHNYEGTFEGDIPLRLAFIRSMNIPAAKLLNEIGIDYDIQYSRKLGITASLPRDLSIALGSWSSSLEEMTRTFAIFPRLGRPITLNYIKKVVDGDGNTLEEFPASPGKKTEASANAQPTPVPSATPGEGTARAAEAPSNGEVIPPQTAYVMVDMMKAVVRGGGTGHEASRVPGPVAGKTGTSNDHRDAWFIGFTPYVMTGVWVGYEKDKPLDPAETGGKAAAPIWADYMTRVVQDYPKNDFPIPDDIVFAYVDKKTGKLASSTSPNRVRVAFKTGGVPNSEGDNLPRVGEPGSGRAATSTTPPEAQTVPATTLPGENQKEGDTDDYLRQGYQQ